MREAAGAFGLRGKKVVDMTDGELAEWIEACGIMEVTVGPAKARRSWKRGGTEAREERARRQEKHA